MRVNHRHLLAAAAAVPLATPATETLAAATERVSVNSAEQQANGDSVGGNNSISGDGRFVAFGSFATNLGGGASEFGSIFLRDRGAGTTQRLDVSSAEVGGNAAASNRFLARDGRRIAFESFASNLVAGDPGSSLDVFLRDVAAGTTARVSVGSQGQVANKSSRALALSGDGRYVVFVTTASNLDPRTGRQHANIFVRDLRRGVTTLETIGTGGQPSNASGNTGGSASSITPGGRFLAFANLASNLVAGDTTGRADVFLRDRRAGRTVLVSVAAGGGPADDDSFAPFVSDDGGVVAFSSQATDLAPRKTNRATDAFVRDLRTGTTTLVSRALGGGQANGTSLVWGISADGRHVVFESEASNLVAGDTNGASDVFVHDRRTRATTRASVGQTGAKGNGPSYLAAISADGGTVAFGSDASNLVPDDTNDAGDVFVRVLGSGTTSR